ncbi:hypothetical protein [Paenibacillus xerothermodurans]|uniref:DUF4179 domain-containing protein n=1 Tax=Paenibacillus xerothermodurans TaxID=1977292 RepID=A0A2W1NLJ6_PAEXE|nr:hypothetical protein [Paenibacillus xerothermodurans]PZE19883.1 hypothetical protein CBW46_016295 [Paenibacillus xerothermodurans]
MKLRKKTITALSFTLGACVFVSTAFADTLLGSGYDQLKASAKYTAAQMEQGLGNYTIEALYELKDNDQTLIQSSLSKKIDSQKQASENTTVTQNFNGETATSYFYADPKLVISNRGTQDKYYVTEFTDDADRGDINKFTNPFNEKGAPEIEKIVDAVVGNLKDYVQPEERADGGRVYTGSLSEAQVPAVVNAVSSFGIKQMMNERGHMQQQSKLPDIESDVFVKKVVGTAVENKSGILESVTSDVVLSGKDKNGVQHDLTLNVVFKLSNIGTTKITLPDLTGANVEKVTETGGFSSKHVGTYKNNIVMEKDGKFIKIGERTLELNSVDKDKITGKYFETVKPEFAAEYGDQYNFTFEHKPQQSGPNFFTYTNAKGEQENGQLHPSDSGKIYLDLNIKVADDNSYHSHQRPYFDGEFSRVFQE